MKKQFLFLIAALFFISVVHAQTMASVVSKTWTGVSETAADFTKTGKLMLSLTYDLTVNSNDRVSGSCTTKMLLDGDSYSITTNISGSIDASVFQVDLEEGGITRSDRLPDGMRWCTGGMGTLTLYKDADHPGYYLLKGTIKDGCGNRNVMELSDR